ncbi:phage tail tube protein [Nonomuraea wenchangensis]|uniref:Phage tail tube protein n=1 Tax=Nonomuraea wenchangensis TaxID=568860 RepID=A0A1I0LU02_9ACTN|nr:hypothetical protein [Nonomuraea wenchangensis]SEU46623.1 hypothetical protein SAMN05421811_12796 [Nonomuraea wenchangensis]
MTLVSMLAKHWCMDVNTAGPGAPAPSWTRVRGLSKWEKSTDDNVEDDGDFDDESGYGSDVITERKWKIEAEGRRKRNNTEVFVPDAGQEYIRKAARKVGLGAFIEVRWYRRDGSDEAYQGLCQVNEFTMGGEKTDLEPFSFTLLGSGEDVEIDNPLAA